MSTPGWYPDPAGTPNTFRYWDGSAWSAQTSSRPQSSGGPSAPPPRPPGRRGRGPLIIAVAALAVLVIIGVFAVRSLTGGDTDTGTADPAPSSTVSGWDDSSPTSSPTPSDTPSPTPSEEQQPCPRAYAESVTHPNDGRIHGGGLSFPVPSGYTQNRLYASGMSWASDTDGASQLTEPGWVSMFAAGSLAKKDGFRDVQQSARLVLDCVATSDYYRYFKSRKDLSSKEVTVAGKPGWLIRSEIRVDKPDLHVDGDVLDILVVDVGRSDAYATFLGCAPLGDTARTKLLDQTVAGLTLG